MKNPVKANKQIELTVSPAGPGGWGSGGGGQNHRGDALLINIAN